ncbi:conjugal transfer pilus-stabilizing protein TraP [Escherichia coli]|uniref:conjugal transfer pilus-stabilizing protein TraP n=1 Tax=Escherichia coli TaxID=562 RepID=UPI0032AF60CC
MRKNNTAIIFGSLFFSCSVMAANGTLAPTVVPMVNGGQASIAISNTSPNLFTVPGDRIKEINFVRQTAPAGQFPVSECWFSSSDSSGRSEIQDICHYRAADAADYVRETDRSLMQLVTALWATLALMYVSLAAITGKYPVRPGKMKCIRVVTADEHLKEVYTEDASLPGKIRKCPVYLPDDRTNRNNGDKNEHA